MLVELIDWFIAYWNRDGNGDAVISDLIVLFAAFIAANVVGKLLLFILKRFVKWVRAFCTVQIPIKIKNCKEKRKYKKTIRQIENLEIPIPNNLLLGKTPEKNPELSKIFQMIEDQIIKAPESYRIAKLLQGLELGEIELKLNIPPPPIEQFDFTKYIKK